MKRHLTESQKNEYVYYLSLVSAVLNGTSPQIPDENCDFERMKQISKETRTDAIFDEAVILLSKKYSLSDELISYAKKSINNWIYIDTVMKYEVELLIDSFEKEEIYNLPMKGYVLKNDYPQPFHRSIADYDILFDIKDIEKVKSIFEKNGYLFLKNDDQQYHFQKKPFMYIEMHQSLLKKTRKPYKLFENQLEVAKIRDNYKYSKEMSLEDYYVYMIIHSAKHFVKGGIGLRMIADEYVFYKKYAEKLDEKYLNNLLADCGMTLFEKRIREMAFKWFSPDSKIENFDDIEEFVLMSYALGRMDVAVMSDVENEKVNGGSAKNSKAKAVLRSVFPDINRMKYDYKFLEKCSLLLPFSWICMWCKRIFVEKNVNLKRGFANRFSYTDDDVDFYANLKREVGLDTY